MNRLLYIILFWGIATLLVQGQGDITQTEMTALNEFLQKAKESQQLPQLAKGYHELGSFYMKRNDYSKAIAYYENAIPLYSSLKNYDKLVESLLEKGDCYRRIEKNDEGLIAFYAAYDLIELISAPAIKAKVLFGIGMHYYERKTFDKSVEFYQKALKIIEANDIQDFRFYENISNLYFDMEDYDQAVKYVNKAIGIQEKNGYKSRDAYLALAIILYKKENYAEAIAILEENTKVQFQNEQWLDEIVSLLNLGVCYTETGNKKLELAAFEKAYERAQQIQSNNYLVITTLVLSETYEKQNRLEEALRFHKSHAIFKDSLAQEGHEKRLHELQIKFDVSEKEKEILLLSKENEYQKKINKGILFVLALGGIFFIILIKNMRVRLKKNKQLREKDKIIFNERLAYKSKQLTTHSLNLLQKKKAIEELKQELPKLQNISTKEASAKINTLTNKINYTLNLDKDWESFKLFFEETNTGFYDKLYATFPNLSPSEVKLAALIRLNFSIKQTADILNQTPDSIKTARYRLRKKLKLVSTDNLTTFLKKIS